MIITSFILQSLIILLYFQEEKKNQITIFQASICLDGLLLFFKSMSFDYGLAKFSFHNL